MRLKDRKGEWLVYGVSLSGKNWKRNSVDFFHMEGMIEKIPIFHNEINSDTDEINAAATQVEDFKTVYTVPLSKRRLEELSPYFSDSVQFVLKDRAENRKYSCSFQEFKDLKYDELISLKTGFAEYELPSKIPINLEPFQISDSIYSY